LSGAGRTRAGLRDERFRRELSARRRRWFELRLGEARLLGIGETTWD
jgi:hypothetical protein